jgi:PKD repeat protein
MKTYKRLLTPLLLLFLSASLFASLQPTVNAQANSCPGNLVTNGDFTNGLTAGPMPAPGAASNWSRAYSSPDVNTGAGCQDAGFIGMWGNMNPSIGEGLQQTLANPLVSGKTYLVSLCVKWANDPNKQPYANFRVRASTSQLTSWGTANTVGLAGPINTTNWTPVNFIWTAPTGGPYPVLTINVENNETLNHGSKTSYGHIDNVCIQELDIITPPTTCQGQPTSFSSNATNATSWNWDFGDNKPHSLQQNPTHTYANAGTYNVTLCVNGPTNCVTKPITVNPKPPAPVINGPTNLCNGLTATYSVTPVPGATYAWTVSNGTINGPSTGSSVNVTWTSTGGGFIGVTVTNSQGCSSSIRIPIFSCTIGLNQCCDIMHLNVTAPTPVDIGSNVYTFTPTLTTPNNVFRVAANIISTERTFSPASCGVNGPVSSHVSGASSPPNFASSLPVAFSHEVIWPATVSGGVNLGGGVAFPFNIQFPPQPAPVNCTDTLKFCVKYTVTTSNCRSCEIIRCYSITRDKIEILNDDHHETGKVAAGKPFTALVQVETLEAVRRPGPLTLSIKPGTGARGARLSGQTRAETVDGTATFSGVLIDRAGEGYVLVVSGPGFPEPLESRPFDVSQDEPRR